MYRKKKKFVAFQVRIIIAFTAAIDDAQIINGQRSSLNMDININAFNFIEIIR